MGRLTPVNYREDAERLIAQFTAQPDALQLLGEVQSGSRSD
jgi:hypothetical protein